MSDRSDEEKKKDSPKEVSDFLKQQKKGSRNPSKDEDAKDQGNDTDGIKIRD